MNNAYDAIELLASELSHRSPNMTGDTHEALDAVEAACYRVLGRLSAAETAPRTPLSTEKP
jgi:hypothetical protein